MKRKKRKLILNILIVIALVCAGSFLIIRDSGIEPFKEGLLQKEPNSDSGIEEAQKDLDEANKEFASAKSDYDNLSDENTLDERQKALNNLQKAYDNLTIALGTMEQRTPNSADVKALESEKTKAENVVEDARKKYEEASSSEEKEGSCDASGETKC